MSCGQMDLAGDYSNRLPMMVIAEMLGIPACDLPQFVQWSDAILNMSCTIGAREGWQEALSGYTTATSQMNDYLARVLKENAAQPRDNLLTRDGASPSRSASELTHHGTDPPFPNSSARMTMSRINPSPPLGQ
ncbi:MAG TPA: hypothetical protein VL282_07195 [Tepidisphaeraceae bacterium]|nr:hypothetical protein [Tepidisphaeraceae bacterium]